MFNYLLPYLSGGTMHMTSCEFADDPCSSVKRSSMIHAARALLSAVTRLLILADMVDVYLLLKSLRTVCLLYQKLGVNSLMNKIRTQSESRVIINILGVAPPVQI